MKEQQDLDVNIENCHALITPNNLRVLASAVKSATVKEISGISGLSMVTVRNTLDDLLIMGYIKDMGKVKNHTSRGKKPHKYKTMFSNIDISISITGNQIFLYCDKEYELTTKILK